MAMGEREEDRQQAVFVSTSELCSAGHPFYRAVNEILRDAEFDRFAEQQCRKFYAEKGQPSIAPGVYFRMLMVGYFEGIDSERGIAWRCADSLALREFLGCGVEKTPPDHSSVSRTRRRLDIETHEAVFGRVLEILREGKLLDGTTVGVDATTLEANAALRSIVRRDSGAGYQEFLTQLAQASGIETPSREDLAKVDKDRPKKGSNDEWKHPHDEDARITKMKDGRTHLAHKLEHAVDMDTGAILGMTVQPISGDTQSLEPTLTEADERLQRVGLAVHEVVCDKGYHANATMKQRDEDGLRSYVSEPRRPRRRWDKDRAAQQPTYANRRRINGARGKRLQRRRGELLERSFAHLLETGGMRRVHLRGHENIRKRLLIHAAGFNLGLLMRARFGYGTPRSLQGLRRLFRSLVSHIRGRCAEVFAPIVALIFRVTSFQSMDARIRPAIHPRMPFAPSAHSATGC